MGTNENSTAEYLSNKLGDTTRHKRKGWIPFFRRILSTSNIGLMTADQVRRFLDPRRKTMIVTRFGKRALKVATMPYYRELPVYFYEPDHEHREASGRAMARCWIAEKLPPTREPLRSTSKQDLLK